MNSAFETSAAELRNRDPDRYLCALFAPAALRPHLFALYAFNAELARIGYAVREPMVGEIRLAWWRETLEGAREGRPRNHDVARALAETLAKIELPQALFEAMIDARSFDLMDGTLTDTASYLDATSGNVMRLAARILGSGDRHDDLAREAGLAYGLAGLLRNQATGTGKAFLADPVAAKADAERHLAAARRLPRPKRALPAFLPATLVPLYLRDPRKDVTIHRRQIALLSSSLRGRL
ncbi:MAG TPA: squalene/phytoene synthase family protein [Rhizomicrobium sp.]|nr:squalene/phytoene synthase family protein [Rhizomicrobium sp.]